MKKFLNILIFCSNAFTAITKGCKATYDHWPSDNPFTKPDSSNVSIPKQQSELHKSVGDFVEPIQETS